MSTNAISGMGTVFRRYDSVLGYVNIAEISAIGGPSKSRNMIPVTSLDSTGGYEEFIAGLKTSGTLTMTMFFTRTNYELMNTDFEDDTVQAYEIVLPDDDVTSLEFEGLVAELPLDITTTDAISMNVTIRITGQVTVNSGSGSEA